MNIITGRIPKKLVTKFAFGKRSCDWNGRKYTFQLIYLFYIYTSTYVFTQIIRAPATKYLVKIGCDCYYRQSSKSWPMTETMMIPTIPSTLSKICLLEIIRAQKKYLQSLLELQIPQIRAKISNVQTTGFWFFVLFLFFYQTLYLSKPSLS